MKVFYLLAAASEKRPWLIVIIAALITVFMGAGMSRITTELSQESMMPRDYSSVRALEVVSKEFGGLQYENALIVADDVTGPGISSRIAALPDAVKKAGLSDVITKVTSYIDVAGKYVDPATGRFDIKALMANEDDMKAMMRSVSPDRKATLVSFQLNPDITENELVRLARELEKLLSDEFSGKGVEVYVSGDASMQKDSQDFMMKETRILFGVAVLFILLILYLTFRRVSDIFLPLLIIIVAISWVMGFMGWVGIAYTTMSVSIMPLMLGINIAYVIHILSRYYEEREGGSNPFDSATTSVKTVGVAVFLTATTTVFGFGSFLITDMPPMRDFGVICVLGIVFSFLLSLTLLPAVIIIRDGRKTGERLGSHLEKMRRRRREARYGALIDRSLARSSLAAYHRHWVVVGCVVAVLAVAGFATFQLKTGADIKNFFPRDMPSIEAGAKITEYFGPQNRDVILLEAGAGENDLFEPSSLEAMLAAEKAVIADSRNKPTDENYYIERGVFSVADLVARAGGGRIPGSREEVLAVVEAAKKNPTTGEQLRGLVSDNGRVATIAFLTGFPETEDEIRIKADILKDASTHLEEKTGIKANATGMSVLISDIMGNLLPTQLKTSGLALLLCLLVLIIVFRSFGYGIATLAVVVFGISVELIMLYVLGWPLDFMTVTISALLIGIGVDFGIHVTHRFREELLRHGASLDDSIKDTVLHVGRALVAAAFTTSGVFAILGMSRMVPLRRFGWTIAVGLIAALVGAVLVLPSLLAIISKNRAGETRTTA